MQQTWSLTLALCALASPSIAFATTYQVGPSKPYTSLQQLEAILEPGDVVEVDGNATYGGNIRIRPTSSGAPNNPVVIRGIPINGKRPKIQGGSDWGIMLNADHVVFEGFEVTGSQFTCVINKGHDITLRDLVVHDCPGHGILGMDFETGDQTLEYIEVYACGGGIYDHQVYVATDETEHPGSRVRLQHSYIHDGNGGNNLKSRAERTEVYSNWLESPGLHVFDLIGADGQDPALAREDSDIVGNVLIQNGSYTIARIGGDGTGASAGRYRFAYNTIVVSPQQGTVFRIMDEIESLAMHDNVFLLPNGGSPKFFDDEQAVWVAGSPKRAGQNNFVQNGMTVPSFFTGTITGASPGLEDFAGFDFVPASGSPLLDAGSPGTGPAGFEIPNPLAVPTFVPPVQMVDPSLQPIARASDGSPDIGAYERGTGEPPGSTSSSSSSTSSGAGGGTTTGGTTTSGAGGGSGGAGGQGGAPPTAGTGGTTDGGGGAASGDGDGGTLPGPSCSSSGPLGASRTTGLAFLAAALVGLTRRARPISRR